MNAPTRVAGFVAALAALFGVAVAAGNAVGPVGDAPARHSGTTNESTASDEHGDEHGAGKRIEAKASDAVAADMPGGLMVSQDGYTLKLDRSIVDAGSDVPVSFAIDGPDQQPVSGYERSHEKMLHLIAVRRDLTGFQHVHPQLSPDGTEWSTTLDLTPGDWRLYADFKAEGADPLTLGTDLSVAGTYQPAKPPEPSRTARVDGYTVTLAGDLTPRADSKLVLSVDRQGKPVTDLQPYLGAYGHLVALRDEDLAYLHVHPEGEPGDGTTEPGPDVAFYASVPSPGSYRLFLDFRHDGVVRTAAFPVNTTGHAPPGQTGDENVASPDHTGH